MGCRHAGDGDAGLRKGEEEGGGRREGGRRGGDDRKGGGGEGRGEGCSHLLRTRPGPPFMS